MGPREGSVIFVELVGSQEAFGAIETPVRDALGRVLQVRPESIMVRRVVTEGGPAGAELWVELSSEEQVFRRGRDIATALTATVRERIDADVWVMFRVVPLSHAFLNGQPRARGRAGAAFKPE